MQTETVPTLYLDGTRFTTLEGFFEHVSEALIPGSDWGHNLDAFNDILRGGFGTPIGAFRIVWLGSSKSKDNLGYEETARQLNLRLEKCHPTNRAAVKARLKKAKSKKGPTVFDWLVEIIHLHSNITLDLK